jgi:hypothetical protein
MTCGVAIRRGKWYDGPRFVLIAFVAAGAYLGHTAVQLDGRLTLVAVMNEALPLKHASALAADVADKIADFSTQSCRHYAIGGGVVLGS